jgi:hypothetical protein
MAAATQKAPRVTLKWKMGTGQPPQTKLRNQSSLNRGSINALKQAII